MLCSPPPPNKARSQHLDIWVCTMLMLLVHTGITNAHDGDEGVMTYGCEKGKRWTGIQPMSCPAGTDTEWRRQERVRGGGWSRRRRLISIFSGSPELRDCGCDSLCIGDGHIMASIQHYHFYAVFPKDLSCIFTRLVCKNDAVCLAEDQKDLVLTKTARFGFCIRWWA